MTSPTKSDTITSTATIIQRTGTVAEAHVREHVLLMDKRPEVGGTNEGPAARETFLASVGGCYMKNVEAAIAARDAEISGVEIEVVGTATRSPNRFVAIDLRVSATYTDRALMEKILLISERGCLLSNTLRNALDLTVTLVD